MISLPNVVIQGKIYESSNSLVYRGARTQDNLAVILKVLKQDYPAPSEIVRYKQEYEITQSFNLEGVIKAYTQEEYQRTLLILLEDFGGESLEFWMHQQPEIFCPMPLSTFLRLAIDLTDILGRIHAAGVIHKDINPNNIVLNSNTGVVKIIDFGIATQFSRTNPTFRSPHVLEGTPAYLSPEQTGRMNRAIDYRTDFYSLGITFYELLTGQLPFSTTDVLELVHCHIAKLSTPPHEINETIPIAVSDIILKLIAKNAEDRYQTAWGIKADLEWCAEQLAANGQIGCIDLGLQDVSDHFQIPQKLYGREAEIAALLAAFERVAEGNDTERGRHAEGENKEDAERANISVSPRPGISASAEMLLVSGYSGVGKSALVQELYKPITAKRGYFISGKFDQFRRNIPYSAIVDALRKLVQQLLGEPDEQLQQWRSRLLATLGSNGQLIVNVIPEVELIIGKQLPVSEVGTTEAQNRFNLVFQQFIRVFCSKEHPLVIFLDDLQWTDTDTLKLIELMLLDKQTQFLFLIGAYRDNEVDSTHPLALTLEGLRKQGGVLHQIVLSPLTLEPLGKLIADTLRQDIHTILPLAELVLRKTGGNPFLVGEFLRSLYSENLLRFDTDHLSWRWNFDQIRDFNITDNVNAVELLLNKLKKLPETAQHLLRLAACIGAEFDLKTLAIICGQLPKIVFRNLLAAIQAGLIQPMSELDEDLLVQDYHFLHDCIQQAAYALIDESQKQVIHLQIGRNLLQKTSSEQLANRLFEIVDQLNQGVDLINSQAERTEIAKLNLMAGQKAKAATAYEAALQYLRIGIQLLNSENWQNEYDLALTVYSDAARAAYLEGHFDEMEQYVEVVLSHAKTVVDKIQVYDSRIQRYLSQGNLKEALKIGLEVLEPLGVTLIEAPSQLDVQRGLEETTALLAGREIEDLINLPEMTKPEVLAAMSILASIEVAANMVTPTLMILIVCKMVNLSITYGNAPWSPVSYTSYGLVLGEVARDIQRGYQFGQLALSLAERLDIKRNVKALTIFSANIMHWRAHFRETVSVLGEAYQNGVETGDLEFAGYAACIACCRSFCAGEELNQLEQRTATYSKAIKQIRRENPSNWTSVLWQTVLNLLGKSENPSNLTGSVYDEETAVAHAIAVQDGQEVYYFYLCKVILCYLFGEYYQAEQAAIVARQYSEQQRAITVAALFRFYDSLVLLSRLAEGSSSEKAAWLSRVNINQEKLQECADHAPMNYLHKFHLVEAEKARVFGQFLEAEEFYEQAIAGAAEHEFIQEEALAYELAAKHYLVRGRKKIAQTYMKEARYCYERWGATAKVKDLETRYPQLFPQSSNANVVSTSVRTTAGTTANTSNTTLDLTTVMKAAQAISSEIELEQLLRSLMQILIENAGAQTGCLLLEDSGEWTIGATCELNEGEKACETKVLRSIPTTNRLPESIIQYVIRTHESVILNDAAHEGNFMNDLYIQQNQTQSLLCLPLLNQSKLAGVLYLENQLTAGAFTPERAQLLNLLSTQAAIAIENAKLYSKLRASESQMTQFLEAISVGVVVVDAVGRPYFVNQRATLLTGKGVISSVTADQLAEAYQVYVAGTDQPYPTEELPAVRGLRGEYSRIDDMEIRQNDRTIPIEAWGTPVFDEQGKVIYAIATFQDITERKQAERLLADYNRTLEQQVSERTLLLSQEIEERQQIEIALRQSEEQRRLTIDFTHIGSWNWNITEDTVDWNDNHARLLGLVPGEVESSYQVWRDRVHPDDIVRVEQELAIALATHTDFEAEYRVIYPDGSIHWLVGRGRGIYNKAGQPVQMLGMILDISDRKLAEAASILEERNRMAREIHDTLAQAFTGVLVHMGTVSRLVTTHPEAIQPHINTVRELARNGLIEARRSVAALRPQALEGSNLWTAIEQFVSTMRSSTETRLVCEIVGTPYVLPSDTENNLLRIGQEAFTNAIKYAQASEIRIELVYEPTSCYLQVKDNGRGFEASNTNLSRGFGLLGMTERAEHIGAQISIESQLGQGTKVSVSVEREAVT